ncbi:hypothetical protein BCR44DRAFT_91702 [Catenaria anguillulae PL171]|uniref:Uncharacterized protein n=1 Tax=Catenaria anguillulae PL171 TaxID=765915 RepID=A0A1Y2HXY0_9FUNG|nr:hypothetical protein BCR44DRAFT_91702 [Catenaria anguillulae PL171]
MARPKSASSASTPAAAAAAAAVAADALAAKANTASEKAAAIAKDKPTTANKKKATTAANKARLALDAAATAHAAAAQAALAAAGLASASLAIADSPTTSSRTSLTETPANVGNVGTAAKSIASNGSKQSIPPRAPFSGAMVSPPLPPPHVPPPHRPAETSSDRREDVIMGEINDDDDALSDLDQFTDADVTPAPRSSVNKEHNRQAPSAAQSSKQATDPSRNRDYFQQDYEPHVRDHYHPNAAQPAPPSDLASALAFLSQMLAQNAPRHEKISSSEDFLAMTTQLGHGNTTSQQALANVTTWASGMPSAQQLGSVGSTLSAVGASPSSNGHHTIHPADMASPPATSRTAQVPAALPSSRDPASGTVTAVPESASLDETETGESILLYIRAFLFLDNLFPVGPTSGKSRWLPELRAMTGLQTLTGPDVCCVHPCCLVALTSHCR